MKRLVWFFFFTGFVGAGKVVVDVAGAVVEEAVGVGGRSRRQRRRQRRRMNVAVGQTFGTGRRRGGGVGRFGGGGGGGAVVFETHGASIGSDWWLWWTSIKVNREFDSSS